MRLSFIIRSLMFGFVLLAMSYVASAQVGVAIRIGPPELVTYEQPICPGDGYLWTPGYWAYDYDVSDYYWVPGTWVMAPEVGFLWTPGYWGWGDGGFLFYDGYWGPEVGFYGGIDYGFGYFGRGYDGGRWDNGHFFYNTTVNHVDVGMIHNVYNTRVDVPAGNRVSFNGGKGGIDARPTSQEEAAAHARHVGPVAAQTEHLQAARSDPQERYSMNHGAPHVAATARPGAFKDSGAVRAGGAGASNESDARPANNGSRPATAIHPKDLPPMEHPAAPNTGNAKMDKKYQQQQDKLVAKQDQDRQKLQQQQDKEHQQLAKQKADDSRTQQVEQKHQQQTQQMVQRHTEQRQQLQQRQAPPASRPAESSRPH
jgi:hypothetical protein